MCFFYKDLCKITLSEDMCICYKTFIVGIKGAVSWRLRLPNTSMNKCTSIE